MTISHLERIAKTGAEAKRLWSQTGCKKALHNVQESARILSETRKNPGMKNIIDDIAEKVGL